MASIQKIPTGDFSPFYGCAIMTMAAMTFGGIIAWSAYSLITQDKAIEVFTVNEPVKMAAINLPVETKAALEKRLTDFATGARAGQMVELKLNITELNALLTMAPDSGYGSYAELLRFEKTDPAKSTLSGQVSLPMNRLKFWEGRKRYLNGEAVFLIYVHEEGIDAKMVEVKVPGKTVAEGFVNGMEIWPWIGPYRKIEPLGTVLKLIKKVTVTADGVTLSTKV